MASTPTSQKTMSQLLDDSELESTADSFMAEGTQQTDHELAAALAEGMIDDNTLQPNMEKAVPAAETPPKETPTEKSEKGSPDEQHSTPEVVRTELPLAPPGKLIIPTTYLEEKKEEMSEASTSGSGQKRENPFFPQRKQVSKTTVTFAETESTSDDEEICFHLDRPATPEEELSDTQPISKKTTKQTESLIARESLEKSEATPETEEEVNNTPKDAAPPKKATVPLVRPQRPTNLMWARNYWPKIENQTPVRAQLIGTAPVIDPGANTSPGIRFTQQRAATPAPMRRNISGGQIDVQSLKAYCEGMTTRLINEWSQTIQNQLAIQRLDHTMDKEKVQQELEHIKRMQKMSTPAETSKTQRHDHIAGTTNISPVSMGTPYSPANYGSLPRPEVVREDSGLDSPPPLISPQAPRTDESMRTHTGDSMGEQKSRKRENQEAELEDLKIKVTSLADGMEQSILYLSNKMDAVLDKVQGKAVNDKEDHMQDTDETTPPASQNVTSQRMARYCGLCGEPGHTWRNCPDREPESSEEDEEESPPDRRATRPPADGRAPNNTAPDGQGQPPPFPGYPWPAPPPAAPTIVLDSSLLNTSFQQKGDKIKLQRFDPKKIEWKDYLAIFLNTARTNKWSEDTKRDMLISKLDGEAAGVYADTCGDNNEEETVSFTLLQELLEERFAPKEREKSFHFQFRGRQMQASENPETYAGDLKRLAKKAFPTMDKKTRDMMTLHQFIDGLTDPDLHKFISLQRTHDLASVVTYASQYLSYSNNTKARTAQGAKPKTNTPPKPGSTVNMVQATETQGSTQGQNQTRSQYNQSGRGGRGRQGNGYNQRNYGGNNTQNKNMNSGQQARGQARGNNQRGRGRGNTGGGNQRGNQNQNRNDNWRNVTCNFCAIMGHRWRDCQRRAANNPNWVYGMPPPENPRALPLPLNYDAAARRQGAYRNVTVTQQAGTPPMNQAHNVSVMTPEASTAPNQTTSPTSLPVNQ